MELGRRHRSPEERRGMFRSLRKRGSQARLSLARKKEKVEERFESLPTPAKATIGTGVMGAALWKATDPGVTHVSRRGLLSMWRPDIMQQFGKRFPGYPMIIGAYAAAPALAYAAKRKHEGHALKETVKEKKRTLGGLSALGVGAFLTERAIGHAGAGFLPEHLRVGGGSRMRWIVGHGVPLGTLAAGALYTSKKLLEPTQTKELKGQTAKKAALGISSFYGPIIGSLADTTKGVAEVVAGPASMVVAPAYGAYRGWKLASKEEKKKRKAA